MILAASRAKRLKRGAQRDIDQWGGGFGGWGSDEIACCYSKGFGGGHLHSTDVTGELVRSAKSIGHVLTRVFKSLGMGPGNFSHALQQILRHIQVWGCCRRYSGELLHSSLVTCMWPGSIPRLLLQRRVLCRVNFPPECNKGMLFSDQSSTWKVTTSWE